MEETTPKKRGRRKKIDAETSIDTVVTQTPKFSDETVVTQTPKFSDETVCKLYDLKGKNEIDTEKNESGATEVKSEVEQAIKIEVGKSYKLPFARLYMSSVAKLPICVCSGEVEILSDEIHDGRINVLNRGTKLKGWIDITEI